MNAAERTLVQYSLSEPSLGLGKTLQGRGEAPNPSLTSLKGVGVSGVIGKAKVGRGGKQFELIYEGRHSSVTSHPHWLPHQPMGTMTHASLVR